MNRKEARVLRCAAILGAGLLAAMCLRVRVATSDALVVLQDRKALLARLDVVRQQADRGRQADPAELAAVSALFGGAELCQKRIGDAVYLVFARASEPAAMSAANVAAGVAWQVAGR